MALLLLGLILAIIIGFWIIKSVIGLVFMLFLAGVIGAAAAAIVGYKGGFLFSIGAGLLGAVLGTVVAKVLGAPTLLTLFGLPVFWSILGSLGVAAVAKVVAPSERGGGRLTRGDRELLG